jgi:hypothetical protein
MKTKTILFAAIGLLMTMSVNAQNENKDYVWSWQKEEKTRTLGLFMDLNGSHTEILDRSSQLFGARIGFVYNRRLSFGFTGSAINYDYTLDELVNDGTYHMEGGHAGIFVGYMLPISNWGRLHFSISTGQGVVMYRYDKEFAEDRPWYQEIIDQENYATFEPGIEFSVKVAKKWWVGVQASYLTTSPIELMGTDEDFLEHYTSGILIRYGLF